MLTLVLTLAMLLSVMVVGAGAATFGDQDSITNKEAVDVCTTLNIIGGYEDGTFRPAGNVTRAEMSKMICVALNGGKDPNMGSNLIATFNDVASTDWSAPYIEYCVRQGIVGGVGGGNFNPNGNITGTQAAKMLLCILGYNASIQGYVGSDYWETNINVDAAQKGLYDGLANIDASAPLTRDSAARMIANALDAYEVEYITTLVTGPNGELTSKVTVQDKVVAETKDKITLLEDKYEADTAVGVFAGNANTLTGVDDGNIRIGEVSNPATINGAEKTDKTFDLKYDLDLKYIGEEVKVLYRDSKDGVDGKLDAKDTIYGVYVTGATTVYNITKGDLQTGGGTADNKIKFNDKEYKVATTAATSSAVTAVDINYGNASKVVVTGASAANEYLTFEAAFESLKADSADTIKFIVKDGEIVKAYVVETTFAQVKSVSSSKVSLTGTAGTLTIEDNDIYDGVAKDDIVAVQKLYPAGNTTYVVTKADIVSAEVTATKDNEVRINGTYMKPITGIAAVGDYDVTSISSLGDTYNFIIYGNYWVAADKTSSSISDYAIVLAIDSSTAVNQSVKLLKADNTEQVYPVDSVNGTVAANAMVGYSVKNNGSVELTGADVAGDDLNTNASVQAKYLEKTKTYNNGSSNFITTADAVAFVQYTASSGPKWIAVKADSTKDLTATASTATFWAVDGSKVEAFALTQTDKPVGTASDSAYGYVVSLESLKDGDDEYTIANVWNGTEMVALKFDKLSSTTKLTAGNYIKYKAGDDVSSYSDVIAADASDIKFGVVKIKEYSAEREYMVITDAESSEVTSTLTLDNPVIIGVDTANKDKGSTTDVLLYNEVDKDYNAVVVIEKDGNNWVVKAIFVDDDSNIDVDGITNKNANASEVGTSSIPSWAAPTP